MLDFLKKYANSKTVRFHMPGHKGKIENMEFSKWLPAIDITEIDGSDNLHKPQGNIKESQKRASNLFKSKESIFLVNGSTSGVYTAITGHLNPRSKALVQRNSHKSAYNAAVLGDIELEYIYPIYSKDLNFPLGIDLDELESKLKNEADIELVFITSPTYYGVVSDIEKIAEIVHSYGAILVVDEAHGSHLSFSDRLPQSAVELGADIVIQSTHKTLLGYTQAAMLHICSDRVDGARIREMATIYQSTSPSYVLIASLDNAVRYFEKEGKEDFKSYLNRLEKVRQEISKIEGVSLIDEDMVAGFSYDITRLVFSVDNMSGFELEEGLRKKGIELEMSDEKYGVAISTLADSEEDLRALSAALREIWLETRSLNKGKGQDYLYSKAPVAKRVLNIREAFYMEKEKLDLEDALGKISGRLVTPYPPGIPILVPGEEISLEMLDYIKKLIDREINIIGIDGREIEIVRGGD